MAKHAERDATREATRHLFLDELNLFFSGATSLTQFKENMDSLTRREDHWGAKGLSGGMVLNILHKTADHAALEPALKAVLREPNSRADAKQKLVDFIAMAAESRQRAKEIGESPIQLRRIKSFVSFYWELQDAERWPRFFTTSREVLVEQGLLDENQDDPDLYLEYLEVMDRLKQALGTTTWGVEHLLWYVGKEMEPPSPEPPEEGGSTSSSPPGDIYARYRDERLDFPDEIVTSLALSLATKRFVILSGISGTGKTQIALQLGKFLEDAVSPEKADFAPPETDSANVYIKLTTANVTRGWATVPAEPRQSLASAVGLPERGKSKYLAARLPGSKIGTMRLASTNFADASRHLTSLYFNKEVDAWLAAASNPGDFLHIAYEDDEAVDVSLHIIHGAASDDTTEARGDYTLIPVKSNWTDPRGLLGYYNPMTYTYMRTGLITLVMRAAADLDNAYLVILDEMNLARVEYYFSDFLSGLESGEEIELMSPSVEKESASQSQDEDDEVPGRLRIPPNLSFIGTVNVDETTHPFSPKVLDRANVIEFSDVDLDRALAKQGGAAPDVDGGLRLKKGLLDTKWLTTTQDEAVAPKALAQEVGSFTKALRDVHGILARFNRQFGYRVIEEISAFVGHALDKSEGEQAAIVQRAFDLQLQQKVVPKLSGGSELEGPLAMLLAYCLDGDTALSVEVEEVRASASKRLGGDGSEPILYPGSAAKLARMLDRLATTGFVGALE